MLRESTLRSVVDQVNSGKNVPALKLVQSSPLTAAVLSKLVRSRDGQEIDMSNEKTQYGINQSQLQAISDSIKTRIKDNENIIQLFPDIELAIQILVSSILSPKDMYSGDLIYKAREVILPAEVTAKMNDVVANHMNGHYKFRETLPEILRTVLFDTGSYVVTILPESIVDEIINKNQTVSTENFREMLSSIYEISDNNRVKSLGFLGSATSTAGSKKTTALESFLLNQNSTRPNISPNPVIENDQARFAIEHVEVLDNFHLLKLPKINEAFSESVSQQIIKNQKVKPTVAQESVKTKKLNQSQLGTMVYKDHASQSRTFVTVPSAGNSVRKSIGRPLVMRLPSEAVIPVYIPGDETKHVGYFVLIDIDGNPVTINSNLDYMDGLTGLMSQQRSCANNGLADALINKAKKNLVGNSSSPTLDQITKIYSSIIENDLMTRLTNGIYGENVKIANSDTIYRIMMARSLANKYTRLVYVPVELTEYYAFKYFPNGVGKSYIDEVKVLTSIRAILLFAKVFAQVKAAINLTHVNMKLDPDDPDPQKTIEILMHEVMRMRSNMLPLGLNSPLDAIDWIQKAGFEFSFEGHPGLPDVGLNFETKNIQSNVPDTELDELLRKQTYMSMGISPETVDNGFNSEFATTFIANNVLFSKRVIQLQKMTTDHTTPHVQKIVRNDEEILKELRGIIEENLANIQSTLTDEEKGQVTEDKERFINDVIERFIENLETDLPKPDVASVQSQTQALEDYMNALDKALDSWISSEVVSSEFSGELSNNIDSVKKIVRHYFIRRWMAENGFMNELSDIVTKNEEGKPTVDFIDMNKSHIEALMENALQLIKDLVPSKKAADADVSNLGTPAGTPDAGSDTGGEGGTGGGTDFGGGGDMMAGLNLPEPGSDVPPEETPPEETTSTGNENPEQT